MYLFFLNWLWCDLWLFSNLSMYEGAFLGMISHVTLAGGMKTHSHKVQMDHGLILSLSPMIRKHHHQPEKFAMRRSSLLSVFLSGFLLFDRFKGLVLAVCYPKSKGPCWKLCKEGVISSSLQWQESHTAQTPAAIFVYYMCRGERADVRMCFLWGRLAVWGWKWWGLLMHTRWAISRRQSFKEQEEENFGRLFSCRLLAAIPPQDLLEF